MWFFDKNGMQEAKNVGGALMSPVLYAGLKRVNFVNKVSSVHTILKIVAHGVVYNLSDTSQAGAASFDIMHRQAIFVAPDGWFDSTMQNMNIQSAVGHMKDKLITNPLIPWDDTIAFLNSKISLSSMAQHAALTLTPYGSNTTYNLTPPSNFGEINDFISLLEFMLQSASSTSFPTAKFTDLKRGNIYGFNVTWGSNNVGFTLRT